MGEQEEAVVVVEEQQRSEELFCVSKIEKLKINRLMTLITFT